MSVNSRYATMNEITEFLESIYLQDRDKWQITGFSEALNLAARSGEGRVLRDFTRKMYFSDMEDDEFVSALYDMPIVPDEPNPRTELNAFRFFHNTDMTAHVISNYLYEDDHTHSFFEIDCILRGYCEMNFEGDRCILPEGSLIIITPESNHSLIACNRECRGVRILMKCWLFDMTFFDILSSNSLLFSFFSSVVNGTFQPNYLLFHMGRDKHVNKTIKAIFYEIYQKDEFSTKGAVNGVNMLFCHMLRNYENVSFHKDNTGKLTQDAPRILHYLQNNYRNATLYGLAKEFNYSVFHMSRRIKDITGSNYSNIVRQLRLNKARELLQNTGLTISEITEAIGYESQSYLSRAFKLEYGITPREYRNGITDGHGHE